MDILGTNRNRRGNFQTPLLFFGTAALCGVLFNILFLQFYSSSHRHAMSQPEIQGEKCEAPISPPPGISGTSLHWQPLADKSLDQLRAMVATTKGYYGRDYSLGLGWNNMRYIIEAALLHAQLLNRTLVIPSFVYARACEYELHVCAAFARMVNRGDAVGWNEWRELPIEQQLAWRIPMEFMLDVPHLRSIYPVVLVSEYLQLQGLPMQTEWASGSWHTQDYMNGPGHPSLHVIETSAYDPAPMVRVDSFEPMKHVDLSPFGQQVNEVLTQRLEQTTGQVTLALSDARAVLSSLQDFSNDTSFFQAIEDAGWTVLHTWEGAGGMNYVKWVVLPEIEIAPLKNVRGFKQQYGSLTEDVIVLKGEIHLHRKPGALRFTTLERARQFATLVLKDIRNTAAVRNLALRLIERIDSITGGRLWMAAHMRRGDFVMHGWAMEGTVKAHFERIQSRLKRGRETLEYLHHTPLKTYNVPDAQPNGLLHHRLPPLESDPIYIATDETDPQSLDYLRNNSVILFKDIMTIQDRREFGWPLVYTDVVALVEQAIMGIGAGYFYGHVLSSVVGGVVNFRAKAGWDPSTALVD